MQKMLFGGTLSLNSIAAKVIDQPAWLYILLFLSPFAVDWPFLGSWFKMVDDGFVLTDAVLYSPWQYFFEPHAYQFLSHANFTPWLTLAYDFDYSLFGMHPLFFRVHELATLGLVHAIFKAQKNRFYILPSHTSRAAIISSALEWSYLTYLVKGRPGSFIAIHKAILNWLPQNDKETISWGINPRRVKYPVTNFNAMRSKKVKNIKKHKR